jgi:hypothetical protein
LSVPTAVEPEPAILALALGALLLAGAVMVWWWRRTRPRRPRAAPPTLDFGPEPPAVVDLLTGGFTVEHDAVVATLVDLAARRRLSIEEVAGGNLIIRTGRSGTDETTPYEDRLLRHVESLAVDGVLPAERLTTGAAAESGRWWRGFVREVTADARARGLCRRRWGLRALAWVWGAVLVAMALSALTIATADQAPAGAGRGSLENLLMAAGLFGVSGLGAVAVRLTASDAQQDTDEGLAAAGRWLGVRAYLEQNPDLAEKPAASVAIWDRLLAYATAMGLAPTVLRQLPLGTEHDRRAWSRVTGRWRPVRVRYPRFRPGWGESPWSAMGTGVLQAVVAGGLAYGGLVVARGDLDALQDLEPGTRDWVTLGGLVLAVVLVPIVAWATARAVLGLSDVFARKTVEGVILRRRLVLTGQWLPRPVQWAAYSGTDDHGLPRDARRRRRRYVAIDDGTSSRVVAYLVRPAIFGQADQGDTVRARVSPRLGYVADLQITARRPGREAPVLPGAAEEALTTVAGRAAGWSAGLAASLSSLESMTDEDGRPILDQTDDDGVPLRQHLDEARSQLDDVDLERLARALPRRGDGTSSLEGLDRLLDGLRSPSDRPPPPKGDRGAAAD